MAIVTMAMVATVAPAGAQTTSTSSTTSSTSTSTTTSTTIEVPPLESEPLDPDPYAGENPITGLFSWCEADGTYYVAWRIDNTISHPLGFTSQFSYSDAPAYPEYPEGWTPSSVPVGESALLITYGTPGTARSVTITQGWSAFNHVVTGTSTASLPLEGSCRPLGPTPANNAIAPAVASNKDSRLELFVVASDNSLRRARQTTVNGPWSTVTSMGVQVRGTPSVAANADGRLEAFAVALDGRVIHAWQTAANGGWSGWAPMGVVGPAAPAAARNKDGRLELFVVAADGRALHAWQGAPNGGWSGFAPLGTVSLPGDTQLAPATNADGRLEVFALAHDRRMLHIWQSRAGSGWGNWASMGGRWGSGAVVVANTDKRLEIFAVGTDGQLQHAWQGAPNGGWSGWGGLGFGFAPANRPAVTVHPSGVLEVLALDEQHALRGISQLGPGSPNWLGLGVFTSRQWRGSPTVARLNDGRVVVFVEAPDRRMLRRTQKADFGWGSWAATGAKSL
ncbi:MAG TPA: hypothetical protein VIY72_03965 [Acidimicrobiales bacterium]